MKPRLIETLIPWMPFPDAQTPLNAEGQIKYVSTVCAIRLNARLILTVAIYAAKLVSRSVTPVVSVPVCRTVMMHVHSTSIVVMKLTHVGI